MKKFLYITNKRIPTWALVALMIMSASAAVAVALAAPYGEVEVSVSQTVVLNDFLSPIMFDTYGTGTAVWSTNQAYAGTYSAKLSVPAFGDKAWVNVTTNMRFGDLNGDDPDEINFWGYVESFGGGSGLGAQLVMFISCDFNNDGVEDYKLFGVSSVSKTDGTAPESHVGAWVQYQPGDFGNIQWQLTQAAHGVPQWTTNTFAYYVSNGFQDDTIIGVAVWLRNTYGNAVVYIDNIRIGDTTFPLEDPETLDLYEWKNVDAGQFCKIVVMGQGNDWGWRIFRLKNLAASENVIKIYAIDVPEELKVKFTIDREIPVPTNELFDESYTRIDGDKMSLINMYILIKPCTPQTGNLTFNIVIEVLNG